MICCLDCVYISSSSSIVIQMRDGRIPLVVIHLTIYKISLFVDMLLNLDFAIYIDFVRLHLICV